MGLVEQRRPLRRLQVELNRVAATPLAQMIDKPGGLTEWLRNG